MDIRKMTVKEKMELLKALQAERAEMIEAANQIMAAIVNDLLEIVKSRSVELENKVFPLVDNKGKTYTTSLAKNGKVIELTLAVRPMKKA